jgi:hypothetical protein
MHEQPQIEIPSEPQPERGPFSFALLVAAAAVVIVLAGFYLWPGRQSPSRGGAQEVHESRLAVNSASPPFRPGQRRPFDVSFEHLPTSWNLQQPMVRVTGLLFAPSGE